MKNLFCKCVNDNLVVNAFVNVLIRSEFLKTLLIRFHKVVYCIC